MPHVQLIGPYGEHAVISTTDHELLHLWFAEWLPRLWPVSLADEIGPRVIVQPLEVHPGRGDWDWFTDHRRAAWINIPPSPEGALKVLAQIRENPPPNW